MSQPQKVKSFATTVSSNAPWIPAPITKQTPWEMYLFQELKKLQGEVNTIKQELTKKDVQIADLQAQMEEMKTQQPGHTHIHQSNESAEHQEVNASSSHFVKEVISVVKEKEKVESIQKNIRIGGLPLGWDKKDLDEDQQEEYILPTDVLTAQLSKVVPFVDLGEPMYIKVKDTQASIHYFNMREKIHVMQQAKSLQGTKVWISDELTPVQLKNRPRELAKVKEARKAGKWAVYRGGEAIIRDFKNPLPSPKE